jgi:CRISPR-associated protein Cas1
LCEEIKRAIHGAERAESKQELLGWEGQGSRLYFEGFRQIVPPPFVFERRMRRPPRDPVNSLLSLAYTVLQRQVFAMVQVVGLDPYVGFMHEARYGLPSLGLDLMEEFRPVIADSVVLSCLLRKRFQMEDFENGDSGCYLNEKKRKEFYAAIEERMKEQIYHPVVGSRISYRRVIEVQARMVTKVLTGEASEYVPFKVR